LQVRVVVAAPPGTAKLPLAATRPVVSLIDQFSVSALLVFVLNTSGKLAPDANMRVPSLLVVSAEISGPPADALAVEGDMQLMLPVVLPLAVALAPDIADV
jgi:hypothetical protein